VGHRLVHQAVVQAEAPIHLVAHLEVAAVAREAHIQVAVALAAQEVQDLVAEVLAEVVEQVEGRADRLHPLLII